MFRAILVIVAIHITAALAVGAIVTLWNCAPSFLAVGAWNAVTFGFGSGSGSGSVSGINFAKRSVEGINCIQESNLSGNISFVANGKRTRVFVYIPVQSQKSGRIKAIVPVAIDAEVHYPSVLRR